MTATQASRSFAALLERALQGETFLVVKNGEPMARITPPSIKPNGAAVAAFLETWEPDEDGFTPEIMEALALLDEPQSRDEERMAWVADFS